jgi:voltage-gated potassium channel
MISSYRKNGYFMRRRIYEIIEVADENDRLSGIYDIFMMLTIFISVVPLAFKESNTYFDMIDRVTVIIFMIDYLLRLYTADYKLNQGIVSFVKYPFTVMAIIDLISILPSVVTLNSGLKLFKVFRLIRTFRIFRVIKVLKFVRYSKSIQLIRNVLLREKDALLIVCGIAVFYVLLAALVILNVEPDTFHNYYDAIYWATVSLTTMGYGDIYPVTVVGRLVTMISSFMGIAVVALPAGLITSGMTEEINRRKDIENSENEENEKNAKKSEKNY